MNSRNKESTSDLLRKQLTPAQRITPLNHTIDPGFVNHRLIETIIGPPGMKAIDNAMKSWPELPEWEKKVRIGHLYTQLLLIACNKWEVKSLGAILNEKAGRIFCSTEKLAPCPDIYDAKRVTSLWIPSGNFKQRVEFQYSTAHISSDTIRSRLRSGETFAIVALLHRIEKERVIFDPLVIGAPWLEAAEGLATFEIMWHGHDFFENFIEDIDEFSKVSNVPMPPSLEPMRAISEVAFKECLAEILGDRVSKDWGGETSDHFGAHVHLKGRATPTSFLLKGPASFRPMTLNHLGKNNDQIYRLTQEPSQMFIVQHCHEITQPVRATLRAFAVQPSHPRRYCFMDGKDSLRLLNAYSLYNKALALSKKRNLHV